MDQNEPNILLEQEVGDELLVVDLEADTAYTLSEDAKKQFLGAGGPVSRRNLLRGGALLGAGAVVAVALPTAAAAASAPPVPGGGGGTGDVLTGRFYLQLHNVNGENAQPPQTSVHGTFTATNNHDGTAHYVVALTGVPDGTYILDYRYHVGSLNTIQVAGGGGGAEGDVTLQGPLQFDAYISGPDGQYDDGTPLYISEVVSF